MNASRPSGSVRYDNSGRVVLVTGGCGGIGRAVCALFAASGAEVAAVDLREPVEPLPDRVFFLEADVSRPEDCRRVCAEVERRAGGIDVLVNNAALQPPDSYHPLHELPLEMWRRMVEVNLSGYTYMAREALPCMLRQGSGVIVNVASGQAHRTCREVPAYGPLKAANVMQAMQWGVQYAREGIRVVSVSPGTIDTPLVRATLEKQGGERELANRHPLGRLGRPEEVAAAVLWLAGPDAAFITGTDLAVDGGLGALGSFADPYPLAE